MEWFCVNTQGKTCTLWLSHREILDLIFCKRTIFQLFPRPFKSPAQKLSKVSNAADCYIFAILNMKPIINSTKKKSREKNGLDLLTLTRVSFLSVCQKGWKMRYIFGIPKIIFKLFDIFLLWNFQSSICFWIAHKDTAIWITLAGTGILCQLDKMYYGSHSTNFNLIMCTHSNFSGIFSPLFQCCMDIGCL